MFVDGKFTQNFALVRQYRADDGWTKWTTVNKMRTSVPVKVSTPYLKKLRRILWPHLPTLLCRCTSTVCQAPIETCSWAPTWMEDLCDKSKITTNSLCPHVLRSSQPVVLTQAPRASRVVQRRLSSVPRFKVLSRAEKLIVRFYYPPCVPKMISCKQEVIQPNSLPSTNF